MLTMQQTHDALLVAELMRIEFPDAKVPETFRNALKHAMSYASVGGFYAQGFDQALYFKMTEANGPWNLNEINLAIQLVRNMAPKEYNKCNRDEYRQIMDAANEVHTLYNELAAPAKDKARCEIEVKSKIQLPPGKKIFKA